MAGLISSVVGFVLSLFTSVFNWIVARCYTSQIVFNCAWEDPRLDREALKLTEEDQVVIITTAGCNVLSLAIEGPKHVYSIDRNHCQNALLELKLAAIREYDYATFWKLFGTGTFTTPSPSLPPMFGFRLLPLQR
jgi:S-adenosylmethionine:diacylglycerol 3-amino-3-carboxypropyl transferase